MFRPLTILILTTMTGLVAFADTSPIPQNLLGTDYITFDGNSFPGSNLICFSAGCGGAFNATLNSGSTQQAGVPVTVWCVDYQLDVMTDSQYITNVKAIHDISIPEDDTVRYGNLTGVASDSVAGWSNAVTDPTGIDGGSTNSSSYRYALAAALVSQYSTSPQDLDGSSINTAIQEAAWYVTYNTDYTPGATWPPASDVTTPNRCRAGTIVHSLAPTGADATDYTCWVAWAEDNANTVNTSAWAVISGPADAAGNLLTPATVNGYSSYQTFLVQVATSNVTTGSYAGPLPEPSYYALLGVSLLGLFVISRRRRKA